MDEAVVALEAPDERVAASGFEAFFHEQHDRLFRALWLMTRNRHEAEEIAQEAFLKLWERWEQVSAIPEPGPAGYLYRTAINAFRSRLRRARVAVRRAVGAMPKDDELALVESREAVVRALAPLPPMQRAAIVLLDVLGLSSEQAAEALGTKPVTVRVRASRGRQALREEMERNDERPE